MSIDISASNICHDLSPDGSSSAWTGFFDVAGSMIATAVLKNGDGVKKLQRDVSSARHF
jgi:hypothetical protein